MADDWGACVSPGSTSDIERENYTIVGVSIGPPASFVLDFRPTFEFYLSQKVSQTLGRQISFNLKGVSINEKDNTIFDMIESNRVDFVYSAPYILGCLESEFEVQPLATVRKRYVVSGKEYILNRHKLQYLCFVQSHVDLTLAVVRYGGAILTRLTIRFCVWLKLNTRQKSLFVSQHA